jgi:hypothetical protein
VVGSDPQDLESSVMERERNTAREEAFQAILSSYHSEEGPPAPPVYRKQASAIGGGEWTLADAAKAEAKVHPAVDPRQTSALYSYMQTHNIPNDLSAAAATAVAQVTRHSNLTDLSQRQRGSSASCAALASSLLPDRVPLRPKKMLRCRKDVRDGKLSILIQPKANPLEGDSSFKMQGKWWTKDSSAVHFVPSLFVTRPPSLELAEPNNTIVYLHLSLMNLKEMDMVIGMEVVSELAQCIGVGEGGDALVLPTGDRHAAFGQQPLPLLAVKASHNCNAILLASYEDELLRDEEEADAAPGSEWAPEHDCGDWGVRGSGHTVKMCIPLLADSLAAAAGSNAASELVLALYMADNTSSAPSPEEGSSPGPVLNRESAVKVFARVVIPPPTSTTTTTV